MLTYKEFVALREESSVEARELYLYIVNDGTIYHQRIQPIIKNLRKKHKKGEYDSEKAEKAWMYAVEDGAKKYHKDFGSGGSWSTLFPKSVRKEVAKELETYHKEAVEDLNESLEFDELNEDVMGMVANGSIAELMKLPEFEELKDKNFYWAFNKKLNVPVFAFEHNNEKVITDVVIPMIKKAKGHEFPIKQRVMLVDALKAYFEPMSEKFDAPKASFIKPELLKYAKNGNLEKVKELVEQGANPNVADELGNTPMDFARVRGHKEVFDYLKANGGKSKFN